MNTLVIFISILIIYFSDIITKIIRDLKQQIETNNINKDLETYNKLSENEKQEYHKSRSYDNVDELLSSRHNKIEKFIYDIPIIHSLMYIFWYGLLEHPRDLRLWLRAKYQRASRGYADSDVWDLNSYLTDVIIGSITTLKKNKIGAPSSVFRKEDATSENGDFTDESVDSAVERWDSILYSILYTFQITKLIQEEYWVYQQSNRYSIKKANDYRKLNNELVDKNPGLYNPQFGYVMTKEECKKYEEGWKLFQQYYFCLWD